MAAPKVALAIALVFAVISVCSGKGESSTRQENLAEALEASEDNIAQIQAQKGFARVAVGRAVTGGWEKARKTVAQRKNFANLAQAGPEPKKATDRFGRKMLAEAGSKPVPCHQHQQHTHQQHPHMFRGIVTA